jgi:hypothetical protein
MIERSLEAFTLNPARLIGDTAYGSAEMLGWLAHDQGIEPHIPVFDKSQHTDGTFSRDDFAYDHERVGDDYLRCLKCRAWHLASSDPRHMRDNLVDDGIVHLTHPSGRNPGASRDPPFSFRAGGEVGPGLRRGGLVGCQPCKLADIAEAV